MVKLKGLWQHLPFEDKQIWILIQDIRKMIKIGTNEKLVFVWDSISWESLKDKASLKNIKQINLLVEKKNLWRWKKNKTKGEEQSEKHLKRRIKMEERGQ